MNLQLFLIGFIAAATPGPDILLTIHTTINGSIKSAFKLLSGILTGNMVMIIFVFFGFSSLSASQYFQIAISLLGGIYLLYIARNIFINRKQESKMSDMNIKNLYKKGLYVNLSNPKAIIFFSAVLVPFVDKGNLALSLFSLFFGILLAFTVVIFATDFFRQTMLSRKTSYVINTISSIIFFLFSIELFRYGYIKILSIV